VVYTCTARSRWVKIAREAPDPLYLQVKAAVLAEIAAGRYESNRRLPSERELALRFQVSRMTARQALLELAREGAIYTRVGKGTFVAEAKIDQHLRALTSFSQDVRGRGSKPTSRVLAARIVSAEPPVAAALRLLPGADVVLLTRLRLSDELPLAIETAHLPFRLFPNLLRHDFAATSLYSVLATEYGATLNRAEQTIEASLAQPDELALLQLASPAAVLRLQRLTFTSEGVPAEYVLSVYRGDRYKFHSSLQG
jgi:GntR family transcriptional regulator